MSEIPKKIKFSEEYFKLPLPMPFKATLMQCFEIHRMELTAEFVEYDTSFKDGRYPLPDTKLIVLLLMTTDAHDGTHVFTTMRRWTPRKWDWYKTMEGTEFDIVKV